MELLTCLNEEELKRVKMVSLKKEQILFNENDNCETIGIVIEGEVDIISYSFEGSEIVFNKLTSGMVFGNNLIFSKEPYYRGSVIAKTPSKVALIYKKDLLTLLKSNDVFLLNYLQKQSDTGKELNSKIKLLSLSNAEERFMYYLHINGERITYRNVTQLASTLFLTRETLSRLLSRLVEEKKIIKKKNYITKYKK